jgi:hypothetical protein
METFEVKTGNEMKKTDRIVSIEGGYHNISNKLFDFVEWGNTKLQAVEAFEFTFQAIDKISH